MNINIKEVADSFAQDKDIAQQLRQERILPTLEKGEALTLDFTGVEGTTQSFVHALISDLFRQHGPNVLDHLTFKGCNPTVQKIIEMVVAYMQEV